MARKKVKGSKQYRMKVVPHRPVFGLMSVAGIAGLLLVATWSAYYAGQYQERNRSEEQARQLNQLRSQFLNTSTENERLRVELASAEQSALIEQKASEQVRAELVLEQSRIAELREEIAFYRGLMAPAAAEQGVSVGDLTISPTAAERRYQYKLVVQQLAANHQIVTGYVSMKVVGSENGGEASYPLHVLSGDVEAERIGLRFKYFQNIEGELQLPEGFTPERIELSLRSGGRSGANVDKRYAWLVQES